MSLNMFIWKVYTCVRLVYNNYILCKELFRLFILLDYIISTFIPILCINISIWLIKLKFLVKSLLYLNYIISNTDGADTKLIAIYTYKNKLK